MELILFGHTMTAVLIWRRKRKRKSKKPTNLTVFYDEIILHLWMRGEQGLLPALPLARLSKYSHSIFVSQVTVGRLLSG